MSIMHIGNGANKQSCTEATQDGSLTMHSSLRYIDEEGIDEFSCILVKAVEERIFMLLIIELNFILVLGFEIGS